MNNTFFRIFRFMKKNILVYIINVFLIGICMLGVQIFMSTLFKEMFEAIENNNLQLMIDSVKFYIIIIVSIFIIFPLFYYLTNRTIVITNGNIRKTVFNKLKVLPYSYFKKHHSGDIISRTTNDIAEMEKVYDSHLVRIVFSSIVGIGCLIYSIYIDWRLSIVTVLGALIILFVNVHYAKILRVLGAKVQDRLAKFNETLTNLLDGIKIIKIFNLSKMIMEKITKKNQSVYQVSKEK